MKPRTKLVSQMPGQMWQHGLVERGDHVLVAVSGGADSMALLSLLQRCRPALAVSAAHFDHRLRDESHRDREHVERYCAENGIACHAGDGDVRAWARRHGESIEAAARRLRYDFLEKTADEIGADKIATAHTRDDNVETVLMRVLRGSGIRGLAGIPRQRARIIRPMLEIDRRLVVAYCQENGVAYVEDPSNRDTRFDRNYIRHDVLPSMRARFPDTDDRLVALAGEAADALATIRGTTDPILDRHFAEETPGVWTLPIAAVTGLDPSTMYVLLGDALYRRAGCERELGRKHYRSISELFGGRGAQRSLPGLSVRRENDVVVFYCNDAPSSRSAAPSRPLPLPGTAHMAGFAVNARVVPRGDGERARWRAHATGSLESGGGLISAVAYFAREHVTPPFIVRPPAPGDRMRPFGMGGHQKKLSDIFIDRKIPYRCRKDVVVVADRHEIIWAAGLTTSESTRITGHSSEVIELRLDIE